MLGRSAATLLQADWSLSPCQGTSGATAGDVTSSLDNTTGITGEQGQRPRGPALQLPSQPGLAQPRPSRGSPPSQG